jgi:uncharacterized protein (DUF2336 family)
MRNIRNDLDWQSSKLAFSISEVVRTSGVGRTLVFAEIKAGRLIARKCGRRTVILSEDLRRWLSAMTPCHAGLASSVEAWPGDGHEGS